MAFLVEALGALLLIPNARDGAGRFRDPSATVEVGRGRVELGTTNAGLFVREEKEAEGGSRGERGRFASALMNDRPSDPAVTRESSVGGGTFGRRTEGSAEDEVAASIGGSLYRSCADTRGGAHLGGSG